MRWMFMAGLALVLLTLPGSSAHAEGGMARDEFTIQFGDFTSPAELDYPAGASGPFPTVVLFHGGCPCDRDEAFGDPSAIQSTNYRDIAQYLVARGFAVLRYNKRYVTGPGQFDADKFSKVTLADTLADARAALAAGKTNPKVDARRLFIYGWSEGAKIASAIAAEEPGLAGLIVQGPDAAPDREVTLAQLRAVALPFASSFALDGKLTADTLGKALAAPNGWFAADFIDQSNTSGVTVNPFFDANKDGVLDIAAEVTLRLEAYVDRRLAPGGPLADYASLGSIADQAPRLRLPVLVLHGQNDGLALAALVRRLDATFAGRSDYTRKEYPGLGHSLGSAASIIDTGGQFQPIAPQPLADLASWLSAHTSRPSALPRTGGEGHTWMWAILATGLLLAGLALWRMVQRSM